MNRLRNIVRGSTFARGVFNATGAKATDQSYNIDEVSKPQLHHNFEKLNLPNRYKEHAKKAFIPIPKSKKKGSTPAEAVRGYYQRTKQRLLHPTKVVIQQNQWLETANRFDLLELDMSEKPNVELTLQVSDDVTVQVTQDEAEKLNIDHCEVKSKRYIKEDRTVDKYQDNNIVCQTDDNWDISNGVDQSVDPMPQTEYDKQLETAPKRGVAKIAAQRKSRFVYSQLLNFLRCKHFMHIRDHHFITTLVADARAWLLANKYKMETHIEYSMLAMAVSQAFLVSQEELNFRALLKRPNTINHIQHLNATVSGNLGRVHMLHPDGSSLAAKLRRPFTKPLTFGAPAVAQV